MTAADLAADVAFGGAGNDTLSTRHDLDGGNDSLYGGDGRDRFIAGAGDLVVGGTLDAPSVTLTRGAMLGAAIGTMVMPGVGTGTGATIGDAIGDKLKGLFKK